MKSLPLLSLAALLAGCTALPTASEPDTLRVLVWNVWHGGNDVDQGPEKIRDLIVATDADVVLMQESYDIDGDRPTTGRWLAEELGWSAYQGTSPHLCVLTRLEVAETFHHHDWHGVGARLVDAKGREVVAWSIWLDYRAYLPRELRDRPDATDEELLEAESVGSSRLPQAKALLGSLWGEGQLEMGVPLLVGGDWNTPSHLDWTVDAARVFRRVRALPLPVSLAMAEAGFIDAFRSVHPNPVQRPGITWTPLFRERSGDGPQGFARIDRLYVKNPSTWDPEPAHAWHLVPSAGSVLPEVWEDDAIPVLERAFPSDHAAVLLELEWQRLQREATSEP